MSITATLIVQIIVFLILVWFTMRFVWPPIATALDERARKIAEGLSAADKAKADLAVANRRVEEQLSAARDDAARRSLVKNIYRPLVAASNGLVETLGTYLELGHSLEATARELFVHANTVRYRLKRVCDVTGWDPLLPREAFVLQAALVVGRLSAPPKAATERQPTRNQT